jgi:hypothetical protein
VRSTHVIANQNKRVRPVSLCAAEGAVLRSALVFCKKGVPVNYGGHDKVQSGEKRGGRENRGGMEKGREEGRERDTFGPRDL